MRSCHWAIGAGGPSRSLVVFVILQVLKRSIAFSLTSPGERTSGLTPDERSSSSTLSTERTILAAAASPIWSNDSTAGSIVGERSQSPTPTRYSGDLGVGR